MMHQKDLYLYQGVFRSAVGSFQGSAKEFVGGFEIGRNIFYNSSNLHYYQNWNEDRLAFQDYNMVYNKETRYIYDILLEKEEVICIV